MINLPAQQMLYSEYNHLFLAPTGELRLSHHEMTGELGSVSMSLNFFCAYKKLK